MPGSSGGWPHDRRRFLQLLGLAGVTSAANLAWSDPQPSSAANAPAASSPPPTSGSSAAPDSASAAPGKSEISEDARALAGVIQRRYGRHLNAKQLEAVTEEIDWRLKSGKRLRDVRLENSDEPDFVFRAS